MTEYSPTTASRTLILSCHHYYFSSKIFFVVLGWCGIALSFYFDVWQVYWIMQFHANSKTVLPVLPCTILANINWTRILITETTQSKPERTPYAQKTRVIKSFTKEEKACVDEYTNNIHEWKYPTNIKLHKNILSIIS